MDTHALVAMAPAGYFKGRNELDNLKATGLLAKLKLRPDEENIRIVRNFMLAMKTQK